MNKLKEIRLDKNELPYPPPKSIQRAVNRILKDLNRYTPQERVETLRQLLSQYSSVSKDSIILRPGSDILIKELIFLLAPNRKIIIPDPTFIVIQNATQKVASDILKVKLSAPEFKFPTEFIQREIDGPTLIFLDNPNNPTGKLIITKEELKALLKNENVILIVDEAYFEFSNYTMAPLIKNFHNLGVLRTLSKSFGLAGAGSGYLLTGDLVKEKLSGLEVMLPYPSIVGSIHALKNQAYYRDLHEEINSQKVWVQERLEELNVKVYSSKTNFFLIKSEIPFLAQKLEDKGVYVYDATNYFKPGYIRVSIGTKEENSAFITGLKEILDD